jgi:hypothetical protein
MLLGFLNRRDGLDLHSALSRTQRSQGSFPSRLQLSFWVWQRLHARRIGPSAIVLGKVEGMSIGNWHSGDV